MSGLNREANAVPGFGSDRTASYRKIFAGQERFLPGMHVIDGAEARDPGNSPVDELRAGLLLGRITSSNRLAPSIIGVLAEAYDDSSGETSMTVTAAQAAELVRRVGSSGTFQITGPPSAGGEVASEQITYSAVDTGTGEITISAASADYIAGSFVQPEDGSEDPVTFIPDGFPLAVTDVDENNLNVELGRYPVGGIVDASQLINWPSDSSLQDWLIDKLNAVGQFVFDSKHGK